MAWWAWLAKLGSGAKAGAAKAATGSKIAKGISAAGKTSAAGSKIASGLRAAKTTQAAGGKIAAGIKSASASTGLKTAGTFASKIKAAGTTAGASKGLGAMMAAGKEDAMKGSSAGGAENVEDIIASTPANTSILDSLNTEEVQKPYKPSAGELGRQVGANIYEQGMSKITGPVRTVGDISGNRSMSDFANRLTDTSSFRSGGKLSYKPEEITPTEARERGLNEMSQIGQQQGQSQLATQRQQKEEYERGRQEELRKYYPNLF